MPNPTTESITAVNEFKLAGDWVQLSPYGKWPNAVGLQVFGKPEAAEVVNEFQSLLNTPARLLGLPWYIGHPDYEPLKQRYKDTRAYGRIKELQAREDGLYGRVKFPTDAQKLISDEAFHGHSVNWQMKRGPDGAWHPFRLKSVGWTNEPQIPVAPITAANEITNEMDRTKLIKQLGLAETATDADIEAAIGALQTKTAANEQQLAAATKERDTANGKVTTLTTQNTELTSRNSQLVTEAANERTRSRDLLVAQGVREGKILVAEQDAWRGKFDKNFTEAANELQLAKPRLNTQSKVGNLGVRNANLSTSRGQAIQDAVNERQAKNPGEEYNVSFAFVKRTKAELFTEATQAN